MSNPKCLVVDFGSEEAMEKAILSTLEDGSIRATVEGTKNNKEFGWSRDSSKKDEVWRMRLPGDGGLVVLNALMGSSLFILTGNTGTSGTRMGSGEEGCL